MGFLDKIQDTISGAAEQTKAKADEVQVKRERTKKMESLGEQVYDMYLNGRLADGELVPACQEIADLDQRIAAAQAAGQAARPQPAAAQAPAPPGQPVIPAPPASPPPSPPAAAAPPPPPAAPAPPPPPPPPGPAGE